METPGEMGRLQGWHATTVRLNLYHNVLKVLNNRRDFLYSRLSDALGAKPLKRNTAGGCSEQSKWELKKPDPLNEDGSSVEAALERNLNVHYNSDQDRDDSGDEGDLSRKRAAVSMMLLAISNELCDVFPLHFGQ
ncbi:hypothetical protein Droror1_Dr00006419 [Drosera rotundifolia]